MRRSVDTDRLRHVAFLATRALPYAFSYAGRTLPGLRCGWSSIFRAARSGRHGPADAPDRITGPAGEYCRVFVQRVSARARTVSAPPVPALEALVVARAFL